MPLGPLLFPRGVVGKALGALGGADADADADADAVSMASGVVVTLSVTLAAAPAGVERSPGGDAG